APPADEDAAQEREILAQMAAEVLRMRPEMEDVPLARRALHVVGDAAQAERLQAMQDGMVGAEEPARRDVDGPLARRPLDPLPVRPDDGRIRVQEADRPAEVRLVLDAARAVCPAGRVAAVRGEPDLVAHPDRRTIELVSGEDDA